MFIYRGLIFTVYFFHVKSNIFTELIPLIERKFHDETGDDGFSRFLQEGVKGAGEVVNEEK